MMEIERVGSFFLEHCLDKLILLETAWARSELCICLKCYRQTRRNITVNKVKIWISFTNLICLSIFTKIKFSYNFLCPVSLDFM